MKRKNEIKKGSFGEVEKVMKLWDSTFVNNVFSFFKSFFTGIKFHELMNIS